MLTNIHRAAVMSTEDSLLEFPCDFAVKVLGHAEDDFDELVVDIVRRHVSVLGEGAVAVKESRGGKYLSVTVSLVAESRAQLDRLYTELSAHERILMVL